MGNNINVLDSCDLSVAHQCNLRCRMCYFWENDPWSDNEILSDNECRDILKQLTELPISENFTVRFTGAGEALLRKNIFGLIEFARGLNLKVQINSNGYVIDKKTACSLADSGLNFLSLSVDSLNPQTHDFLRGRNGVLENAFAAIENMALCAKTISINIHAVISGVNIEEVVELAEWAQRKEAVSSINFHAIMQPYSFTQPAEETWFKRDKYRFLWPDNEGSINRAIDGLIVLRKKGSKISNSIAQFNLFRGYFIDPLRVVRSNICNLDKGNSLIVDPVGNVSMCQMLGLMGNIRKNTSLREIVSSVQAQEHKKNVRSCRRSCSFLINCFCEEDDIASK